MKLWCKAWVGSYQYEVYLMNTTECQQVGGVNGVTYHEQLKIFINATMPKARIIDTFIHEMGHALLEQTGGSELIRALADKGQQEKAEEIEETLISVISPAITTLLTRNNWLTIPELPRKL